MKSSQKGTYLEQGTRLECSRKKQEELDQEKELKSTKCAFTPSGREEAPEGMEAYTGRQK